MKPAPVVLEGHGVRLEPLCEAHADDLAIAGRDPAVWRWLARGPFVDVDDARGWIASSLEAARTNGEVIFATTREGRAVGSTRFMAVVPAHLRLEIGWTWLSPDHWRDGTNRAAKRLMMEHVFEVLGARRLEFKTDLMNERSQRAIEALGATREGVFRHHMVRPDGSPRDSVYYSILAAEWPTVKARLAARDGAVS